MRAQMRCSLLGLRACLAVAFPAEGCPLPFQLRLTCALFLTAGKGAGKALGRDSQVAPVPARLQEK